jgi:hypothetical protein
MVQHTNVGNFFTVLRRMHAGAVGRLTQVHSFYE